MSKVVTILSGGMDSTVLAEQVAKEGHEQFFLSFNYGQKHKKELSFAARTAYRLKGPHKIVNLTSVTSLLTTSALTSNVAVPDGHYNEATMRVTVVPNRNPIMLAVAFSVGSSWEAKFVATGIHAGDRFNYPDCRHEFASAFQAMEARALEGFTTPSLWTPFITLTKADIAKIGKDLAVPFHKTWSCYKGGEIHCGRCGTCVERLEALNQAGVEDKTIYEDYEYWKTAVKEYEAAKA